MTPFHLEDVVEEIATKRQGKLDNKSGIVGEEPDMWRVYFSDGKEPIMKHFKKAELDQLRLVQCPHQTTEPGFYPATSILD